MRIGIITLVGDNYGNKFQNYAVEQLLSRYGEVETFQLERKNAPTQVINNRSILQKIHPNYIREVFRCRLMGKYDIKNVQRSVLGNLFYVFIHKQELINMKKRRKDNFQHYTEKFLHVSKRIISSRNCLEEEWLKQHDFFVCGSDQIWNPTYSTTSDLAFLSFAPEKSIALAPSFGLAVLPEDVKENYSKWIRNIKHLSVREVAGQKIIKDLTGRNSEVLLDPTMALESDVWKNMSVKPRVELPDQYVVCYFLGRVDKTYQTAIYEFAKTNKLEIVRLFDIEVPEYYEMDPNEVLYCILHAKYVLTDSFHGAVFSILFHREFFVFERNEGVLKMTSRMDTLLEKFGLCDRNYGRVTSDIKKEQWEYVDRVLYNERIRTNEYIETAINGK